MITKAPCEVTVVIVNYRTSSLAKRCVESLAPERAQVPTLRVTIVDGGSSDGSAAELETFAKQDRFRDWVQVLPLPINGGFGWANNQAILRLLRQPNVPDFIHLLNPDTQVEPGAVRALVNDLLLHSEAAATGSQLLEDEEQAPTSSAFRFPTLRSEFARGAATGLIDRVLAVKPVALSPSPSSIEADWVTGASVLLRSEALKQVGLFDDAFFLYHEELELMWRLRRAGWTIRHEPRSRVRHIEGAATGVHGRAAARQMKPRRPGYWYESRRRFFVRSRGTAGAAAAAALWVAGHLVWRARQIVGLAPNARHVESELTDQLRHALPRRSDLRGGPVDWNAPCDRPPAWMKGGQDG